MTRARAAAVSLVAAFVAVLGTVTGLVAPTAASATGTPTSGIVSAAAAPNGAAGTTYVMQLPYAGVSREYHAFVPTKAGSGPRPLLVAMHGANGNATDFEAASHLDNTAAKAGVIVIYPQGLYDSWNAGTCCNEASADNVDDVGFLTAVIKDIAAWRAIDKNRVAMGGVSNGGMMSYRFACERSDLVDVIAVMAGAYVAPSCSLSRPVSLIHVHGLKDPLVPFLGVATSPIDASGFPNVKGEIAGFGAMDGCGAFTSGPYNGSTIATAYDAQSCPAAGTAVELVTSSTMGHVWATGSADQTKYGVDMAAMTWGFVGAAWASRPAPVAL